MVYQEFMFVFSISYGARPSILGDRFSASKPLAARRMKCTPP